MLDDSVTGIYTFIVSCLSPLWEPEVTRDLKRFLISFSLFERVLTKKPKTNCNTSVGPSRLLVFIPSALVDALI